MKRAFLLAGLLSFWVASAVAQPFPPPGGGGGGGPSGGGIQEVMGCTFSVCNRFDLSDGDLINMANTGVGGENEGLRLPQGDSCENIEIEGSVCWNRISDTLHIGTGSGNIEIGTGESLGDITQVFGCTEGACTSITAGSTDLLDLSAIDPTDGAKGLIFPQNSGNPNCADNIGEGSGCWGAGEGALYFGDGAAPVKIGPLSLDESFFYGRAIFSASSRENAFFVGTGDDSSADGTLFYTDETGPKIECVLGWGATEDTCDFAINVADGDSFVLNLGGEPELTIASSGAVTLGTAMKERKRLLFRSDALTVDGTHCLLGTDVVLNSETYHDTVTCAHDDEATIKLDFLADERWDEATLTITAAFFQSDSIPDGNYELDWSGYCAGDGDAYLHNTFTSETGDGTMTFAASGYAENDLIIATTTGQVPIGTCAEGDMVRVRAQLDATATTAETPEDLHLLWVRVEVLFNSW